MKSEQARYKAEVAKLRLDAERLCCWVRPEAGESSGTLAVARVRLEQKLTPQAITRLAYRLLRLPAWEQERAAQLRKAGASPMLLLQFLGATQDQDIQGRPTRDSIVAAFSERAIQRKAARRKEIAVRVAVPTALVGVVAVGLPWVAINIGLAVGVAPDVLSGLQHTLSTLGSSVVNLVNNEVSGWLPKIAAVLGLEMLWSHSARVFPDLKAKAFEPEVLALEASVGPEARSHRIHSALRHIPPADQHLLTHLLPVELRAFLDGSDQERRELLLASPPPLLAQVRCVMAGRPPSLRNVWPVLRDLGDLCLPDRWRQATGFKNSAVELDDRLVKWRKTKPDTSAADALVSAGWGVASRPR